MSDLKGIAPMDVETGVKANVGSPGGVIFKQVLISILYNTSTMLSRGVYFTISIF